MPERRTPGGRYRRRRPRRNYIPLLIAVLAVILVALVIVAIGISGQEDPTLGSTPGSSGTLSTPGSASSSVSTNSTAPTEPKPFKVSTATISNTGDFLMHLGVTNSGYDAANGTYHYERMFTYLTDYVQQADYAVGNLETTLAGTAYNYSGFPMFNSPDGFATSLKEAGFDLILTANNHTYDTREHGFLRTQEVLRENGLEWLGTTLSEDQTLWQVKEINGIKVGMVCYTYATHQAGGKVSLNGNAAMSDATSSLISTFDYDHLEDFYAEMEANISAMEAAGAEAVMLYIHWGNEYRLVENTYQNNIAQKMCDLGVDVIVGGHPHVVQPMELLTSQTDPDHKTVCLYSMGNAVSNQRLGNMGSSITTAHTEDGVWFSITFAKYSDGTVILESADILPLWVNMFYDSASGNKIYQILPLDKQVEDWKTQFQLTDTTLKNCENSYERTMKIVGGGLDEVRTYLDSLVAQTEERLGIQ